jgi:hypothetical protein
LSDWVQGIPSGRCFTNISGIFWRSLFILWNILVNCSSNFSRKYDYGKKTNTNLNILAKSDIVVSHIFTGVLLLSNASTQVAW